MDSILPRIIAFGILVSMRLLMLFMRFEMWWQKVTRGSGAKKALVIVCLATRAPIKAFGMSNFIGWCAVFFLLESAYLAGTGKRWRL